jgi:hypothetical protein
VEVAQLARVRVPLGKALVGLLDVMKKLQVEGGVLGPELNDEFCSDGSVAAVALDGRCRGLLARRLCSVPVALVLRRTSPC